MQTSSSAQRQAIFLGCERFLNGHGPRRPRHELEALAAAVGDDARDVYGSGGVVEELEREVAELLGKPAAVFMPSGTMAQQIALRVHADATGCRVVGFHATCHLELHEQRGYSQLHGLDARLVGRRDRLIERADLETVVEPLAALLLELPQREIGGLLPSWEALAEQAEWARQRGVRLHLDGARLWECAPFYQKTIAELCAPFDSVYVSFYKALGAIAGAMLAGSVELVQRARVWQRRHGGNLVSLYPYALSAREGLRLRLGRMATYRDEARRVARCLSALPGVRIAPDPPQVNLFHAYIPVDGERLIDASAELAQREKVALFTRTRACDVPGVASVELSIGDGAAAIGDAELGELLRSVVDAAARPALR
jgi:threonine aldolase